MTLQRASSPLFAACLAVCLILPAFGQNRKPVVWNNVPDTPRQGVEHYSFQSEAMDREIGYAVALPSGYAENANKRYPVLYFLHGAGGNENSDGPGFSSIVNRLVEQGLVPPVICVFPNGGMSGYRNHPDTGINVETMITEELLPLVDSKFRTLPHRDSRVIAGYSMGGGGAVHLALKHPKHFSAAASLAGSMVSRRTGELPEKLTVDYLKAQDPEVRLYLVGGYDDKATFQSQDPFLDRLNEAQYSYTYRTLRGVPHNLGIYYDLAGEELSLFLLRGIEFN